MEFCEKLTILSVIWQYRNILDMISLLEGIQRICASTLFGTSFNFAYLTQLVLWSPCIVNPHLWSVGRVAASLQHCSTQGHQTVKPAVSLQPILRLFSQDQRLLRVHGRLCKVEKRTVCALYTCTHLLYHAAELQVEAATAVQCCSKDSLQHWWLPH